MFCHYCGNRIPNDATFCNNCGNKVSQPPTNSGIDPTMRSGPPSQPLSPGWQPPVQAGPPSQPGVHLYQQQSGQPSQPNLPPFQQSGPLSQPGVPPYQQQSVSSSSPGWQPTVQAGPSSQPNLPPFQQQSGPISSPGWQPTVQVGPSGPNWPPQTGQQASLFKQPGQQTGQFISPSQPGWQGAPQQPGTLYSSPISQSPLQQPPSGYPAWPGATGVPLPPDKPTAPPPPPSPFQHWLIRTFQPSLAGNALLGIVLGALVAVVLGGAIAVILEAIFHAIAPSFASTSGVSGLFHPSGQDIMDYVIGVTPLHAPFRDGMQLFFLMHGAGVHTQYSSGAGSGSSYLYSYSYNATLSGLLIIPALVLTLGGYVAASTDLQNRAVSSLLRGLAIALPYAALLIALAPQVNGSLPFLPNEPTTDVNTLTIDSTSLFIFGLIWGAIFGVLGATLKLGRGRWRHMMVQFLHTRPRPQIIGMITGGLAASGLGIILSMLVLYGLLAFTAFSIPIFTQNLCNNNYGFGNWQYVAGWAIAQGPLHAANLFFYSFGAPVNIANPKALGNPCFYINSFNGSDHVTYSLLGGSPHLPNWTFAFLAIPVISLFLGGRVSAVFGRAQTTGQGLVQGALIAVPFTVLMMLLSVFTMLVYQNTGPFGSSSTNSTLTQSFGVGAFDLLLWALLSGAVIGGLGGVYQTSSLKQSVRGALSPLAALLRGLGAPGYALFDRLRGGNRSAPRTTALRLLYGAVFSALILLIAVGAAAVYFISLNQSIPFMENTRIRDILSTILIALPGLLLISAGAAALAEEKIPQAQPVTVAPAVMPPGGLLPPMPPGPPQYPPPQYPPQSYPNYQGGV